MMQWEFKKYFQIRWRLLKACTFFSFKESTAYVGNNYGNTLSIIIYMLTYLVFIGVLFNRVKLVAGYSYGEILLLTMMTQLSFYIIWSITISNTDLLAKNVKSGDLDLWMTRPVPLLWFVSFQKVDINSLFVDAVPSISFLMYLVMKNYSFIVTPINLARGTLVMIMGLIISHCFMFIMNLSCFWTAENQNMRNLAFELEFFGDAIPFEGYSTKFRNVGMLFVPSIITSALTTSVLLGKSNDWFILPIVLFITVVFLWLTLNMWKIALRHYSSASS